MLVQKFNFSLKKLDGMLPGLVAHSDPKLLSSTKDDKKYYPL